MHVSSHGYGGLGGGGMKVVDGMYEGQSQGTDSMSVDVEHFLNSW